MYVRALIVVLIVLNAGVALWWALQAAPAAPAAPAQPAGVARLELLPNSKTAAAVAVRGTSVQTAAAPDAGAPPTSAAQAPAAASTADAEPAASSTTVGTTAPSETLPTATEKPPATTQVAGKPADVPAATAASTSTSTPTPTPTPAPERCASLGPYATRSDADAALARVRGQATRTSVREDKDAGVGTFRVMLPNVGDRAAAQALVKRITAAGMGDYYVIAQGDNTTVALGQYQSRERAERRQASLVSAGFPAQLVSSGTGQSRWWIDVRSTLTATALQGAAGAARQRSLDCAALR